MKHSKPQKLAKTETLETTLNLKESSHFTKLCPGRALGQEQIFMSETVVI